MAATANWYGQAFLGQWSATAARRVDWATDTIKVALTTSSYTPNQDTDVFFSDVTNEITGTGYTAGGATLGSKSTSYDNATNETRLLAGASSWTTATFTYRYAIVYKSTGVSSTSPLIAYFDTGGNQTVTLGTETITWDATFGVVKVTAS
jgi:hypothetical protein